MVKVLDCESSYVGSTPTDGPMKEVVITPIERILYLTRIKSYKKTIKEKRKILENIPTYCGNKINIYI